jgi:mannose-6-phosphate isomerase
MVESLRGALRTYAWGSRTAIAEFSGRPFPTAHPEAEVWLGAHASDPAMLQTYRDGVVAAETSLADAITADPARQLGPTVRARFGDRLPFLVKVLAADEPLSLQAHPSAAQAVEGYRREDALGVPVGSPVRNYRDASHKPELLVALSDFEALAGFRPAARTVALMQALGVDALAPYIALLTDQSAAAGLRALFTTWITAPQPDVDALITAVLDGAVSYLRTGAKEFAPEVRTVLELGERYPGDAGVLAALLLNRVVLQPGEGVFLPAGILHSYLRGMGMEVMANSDNVLRGGLTPKHVDVPELLRVLDFAPLADPRAPVHRDGIEVLYDTPAPEFAAAMLTLDGDSLGRPVEAPAHHGGPQILVCTRGSVTVRSKSGELGLNRGQAAWVPADDGTVWLESGQPSQVFRATVGL